jgi:hypothetical protein
MDLLIKVFARYFTTYIVFFSCVQSPTLFMVRFWPKRCTGIAILNLFHSAPS